MNIMKNTDLTQQSAAYTAPSVRVVNVYLRHAILYESTPGEMQEE